MASKKTRKQAEKIIKKLPTWVIVVAIILVVVIVAGYFVYDKYFKEKPQAKGAISFHFLTLGNSHSGDCIYIKAGENDILIDAGSTSSSVPTISAYVNQYVTDNAFEYVVVTHAHEDHYAGFAGSGSSDTIFDLYECKNIIDFPKTNSTTKMYERYLQERDAEVANGANHYTALQCWNNEGDAKRSYTLSESVEMKILYNYYYDHNTSNENNYSVCVMFTHGDRNFLFTGDLEGAGEEKLVEYNNLPQMELYKAGHHGSGTASTAALIDVIKPKITVASTVSCYDEYDQTEKDSYFPAKSVVDNVVKYNGLIYVTSIGVLEGENIVRKDLNGNVVVASEETGVSVDCSGEFKRPFTEHEWHLANRT